MDGDGLEDIIVGVAYSYGFLPIDNEDDINDICAKQGLSVVYSGGGGWRVAGNVLEIHFHT